MLLLSIVDFIIVLVGDDDDDDEEAMEEDLVMDVAFAGTARTPQRARQEKLDSRRDGTFSIFPALVLII